MPWSPHQDSPLITSVSVRIAWKFHCHHLPLVVSLTVTKLLSLNLFLTLFKQFLSCCLPRLFQETLNKLRFHLPKNFALLYLEQSIHFISKHILYTCSKSVIPSPLIKLHVNLVRNWHNCTYLSLTHLSTTELLQTESGSYHYRTEINKHHIWLVNSCS